MRFPVDGQFQLSQLYSTKHDAWDIIGVGNRYPDLLAPENGVIERSAATVFYAGYVADEWIRIKCDSGWSYQMHHTLKGHRSPVGTRVGEGQKMARIGNTGKSTGAHVHWIVINPQGKRIDPYIRFGHLMTWGGGQKSTSPKTYITYNTIKEGDEKMINDADNEYYRWNKLATQIRGRDLFSRQEFRNAAVGRTWLAAMEILSDDKEANVATANAQWARENKDKVLAEIKAKDKQLADIQTALENEKAKPPKEVVKEVEKIVEVPVLEPITDKRFLEWLVNKIKSIFKRG